MQISKNNPKKQPYTVLICQVNILKYAEHEQIRI